MFGTNHTTHDRQGPAAGKPPRFPQDESLQVSTVLGSHRALEMSVRCHRCLRETLQSQFPPVHLSENYRLPPVGVRHCADCARDTTESIHPCLVQLTSQWSDGERSCMLQGFALIKLCIVYIHCLISSCGLLGIESTALHMLGTTPLSTPQFIFRIRSQHSPPPVGIPTEQETLPACQAHHSPQCRLMTALSKHQGKYGKPCPVRQREVSSPTLASSSLSSTCSLLLYTQGLSSGCQSGERRDGWPWGQETKPSILPTWSHLPVEHSLSPQTTGGRKPSPSEPQRPSNR